MVPGNADPPVCRIVSADAWRFQMQQQARQQRASAKGQEIKEIRLTPSTGGGDIAIKAKQVLGFLEEGHRIQVQVKFSGREMAHKDLGKAVIAALIAACGNAVKLDREPTQDGKRMNAMLVAAQAQARSA